jgi:hypothetical protein
MEGYKLMRRVYDTRIRVNYSTVVEKGFVNRHLRVNYSTILNRRLTINSICILLKEENIDICSDEHEK